MHTESCPLAKLTGELDGSATLNNTSILEDDLALSSSTLEPIEKSLQEQTDRVPCDYNVANRVVYVNEDTMDCNYPETRGTPNNKKTRIDVSSPEMFESDDDDGDCKKRSDFRQVLSRQQRDVDERLESENLKPLKEEVVVAKSDCYLLARMNKFLTGVPPPPKHTICQSDCGDLLAYIRENRQYFLVDPLNRCDDTERVVATIETAEKQAKSIIKNPIIGRNFNIRGKNSLRNLTNAFDACDQSNESTISGKDESSRSINAGTDLDKSDATQSDVVSKDTRNVEISLEMGESSLSNSQTISVASSTDICANKYNAKRVTFMMPHEEKPPYHSTIGVEEAKKLEFSMAYKHKTHGIHYNRSKAVEEFEDLTMKLCQRYIGAETQSSCNIWFTKQTPPSVKKRNLLARRANGQSPGKRLSHLAKRRRTFSSANLQGLGMGDKKQLVLNIKKPTIRKGKSPRGKSPRGKSPRGKSPRSSAKKRGIRPSSSPRKSKLETSKRALFQSPPNERAGPSRSTSLVNPNSQKIKRALFSTSKTKDETPKVTILSDITKTVTSLEDSRKRKSEDELEGPRFKWAKSLSFDCTRGMDNNSTDSWSSERHSTGSFISKSDTSLQQVKCELSEAHRKKLLWAVAEALRSKGIGLGHPRFKECASQLARTVKKYMPDLENRNVPRKPGSTSDRMLKLAKHHVLLIVETKPAD